MEKKHAFLSGKYVNSLLPVWNSGGGYWEGTVLTLSTVSPPIQPPLCPLPTHANTTFLIVEGIQHSPSLKNTVVNRKLEENIHEEKKKTTLLPPNPHPHPTCPPQWGIKASVFGTFMVSDHSTWSWALRKIVLTTQSALWENKISLITS